MTLDDLKGTIIRVIDYRDDIIYIQTDDWRYSLFMDHDCCETRYFECADDLSEYTNSTILAAYLSLSTLVTATGDDTHEVAFLRIMTTVGELTFSAHNEHNGYYSGFSLIIERQFHQYDTYTYG